MEPQDIQVEGLLVVRAPEDRLAFEKVKMHVTDVIGVLYVDDNGFVKVRKLKPEDPERQYLEKARKHG